MKLQKIKSKKSRRVANLNRVRRRSRKQRKVKLVNDALKIMQYRFLSFDELEAESDKDEDDKGRRHIKNTANCLAVFIDPSIRMIKGEHFNSLSKEAKQMVKVILHRPKQVTSHTGTITKDMIISHFRKKGWKYPLIWNVMEEVSKFVKGLG